MHYINLRNISNDGERGFLPIFGPAFINFYNRGAYAGQVLLSIRTELHDSISLSKDAVVEPIAALNEVPRVHWFSQSKLKQNHFSQAS